MNWKRERYKISRSKYIVIKDTVSSFGLLSNFFMKGLRVTVTCIIVKKIYIYIDILYLLPFLVEDLSLCPSL